MHRRILFFFILFLPLLATAHPMDGTFDFTFTDGLIHPLSGLEHFLAMFAVGILSAQIGGRAVWYVPASFVTIMGIGSFVGTDLIFVDYQPILWMPVKLCVVISVFVLGMAIHHGETFPLKLAMAMVALFGFCHGFMHGYGSNFAVSYFKYAAGFMTSTAGIHLFGVVIGFEATKTEKRRQMLHHSGIVIALIGVAILLYNMGDVAEYIRTLPQMLEELSPEPYRIQ